LFNFGINYTSADDPDVEPIADLVAVDQHRLHQGD